jgi:hypothetical protein
MAGRTRMDDNLRAEAEVAQSKARRPTLSKVSKAITATVPLLTLLRFDSLARCYEASAVGALIMRSYGFDAKVIPAAAVVVRHGDKVETGSCGGSFEDVPRWLKDCHQVIVPPPSEIESVDGSDVTQFAGAHVVIRAKGRIVDLTVGQLNAKMPGFAPNFAINAETELDEQAVQWRDDISISWHAPRNAREVQAHARAAMRTYDPQLNHKAGGGFLADAKGCVAAFLNVNGDVDRWFEQLQPGMATLIMAKANAAGFGATISES